MKLFIRRMGQGIPVVILHGLLGLSDNWITFSRQLALDYEVFIPDLRNHGQSPHDSKFNFPVLVEDIHELILDQVLKQVILIGHSLGGQTAMLFALEYPELVSKLVVVDIALRNYSSNLEHRMLIDAMLKVDFSNAQSRSDVERQLQTTVPSLKLRQFLLKNIYWKDKETLDWRLDLHGINDSLPMRPEEMASDKMFPKPVLLVRGGLSDYVLDADVIGMKKQFPQTSVITLGKASHWVHADVPGEFYDQVHDFLMS